MKPYETDEYGVVKPHTANCAAFFVAAVVLIVGATAWSVAYETVVWLLGAK